MRIAVQAADLDHARIDGTRIYIREVLARIGALADDAVFDLYHRGAWNPELAPGARDNYRDRPLAWPLPYWTQTRFAAALFRDRPDVLWMPMHGLPWLRPRGMRSVVTIHDLAFKIFPETFAPRDLRRLNLLTDHAVRHADRLIAVSAATRDDLVRFYPNLDAARVTVVHHGFGAAFGAVTPAAVAAVRAATALGDAPYILYVGALQPRKNIPRLVAAFDRVAARDDAARLVLASSRAWHWEDTEAAIAASPYSDRIVVTGTLPVADIAALYAGARVFAFPSLYEGFGIPILEAFASGVPVVAAANSSLPEVAGDAALLPDATDTDAIAAALWRAYTDDTLRQDLIARGHARMAAFSWDRCARETLAVLRGEV